MKEEILDVAGVRDFLHRMGGCMTRAHSQLMLTFDKERGDGVVSRSFATVMNDYVMREAKYEFADDPDVTYRENSQLRSLVTPFAEIRSKKANSRFSRLALNTRTAPTKQWTNLKLPDDLSPLDKLFVGYSVSRSWRALREMALMEFQDGKAHDVIVMPFEDPNDGNSPDGTTLFIPPLRLNVDAARRIRQAEFWDSARSGS